MTDLLVHCMNGGPSDAGGNGCEAQDGLGLKFSIQLQHSKLSISTENELIFDLLETIPNTGMFGIFKQESARKFSFRCSSRTDMVDWMFAAK